MRAASRQGGHLGRVVALATVLSVVGGSAVASAPSGMPSPGTMTGAQPDTSTRPWLDTSLTIDQRISALLSQMTLDEKIGQMTQIESDSIDPAGTASFLLGSILASGSGNPKGLNDAQDWYAMVDGYQQAALGTRLGIPIMYGVDMVHGASHMMGTTVFPHNIGLGATGDPGLVTQVCEATAAESAAAGVRWTFGPVVAVPQDVRWGRTYEGYGEDTGTGQPTGCSLHPGSPGRRPDRPVASWLPLRSTSWAMVVRPSARPHRTSWTPSTCSTRASRTWMTPPSRSCSCRPTRPPSTPGCGS